MKKKIITVPKGIRFLSEWKDFKLPNYPVIINKSLTGCGFTEFCLTNSDNVILCAPRKALLVNKEKKHSDKVLYVRNEYDVVSNYDKDITKDKSLVKNYYNFKNNLNSVPTKDSIDKINAMKLKIAEYIFQCYRMKRPVKILVTYDSFRHVKDVISKSIDNYFVVIDEFQSIFTDSKFKSDTELGFINHLQGINRLAFASATPYMEKYLDMIDIFKDLPYYELDWESEDPYRIIKPYMKVINNFRSITTEACNIIKTYQDGNFEKTVKETNGILEEIESRECVIYVNSVKNICDIIRKAGLKFENTNVICADTSDNEKKIRAAFKADKSIEKVIGSVPQEHETNKMFTLCTRTVYLGADFYSTNARSFIFSDANIDCLAVDITVDLPQILGRQRSDENPWKNTITIYARLTNTVEDIELFNQYLQKKIQDTNNLLENYNEVTNKQTLKETFQRDAVVFNYKYDFIAVNKHGGNDLIPVFNDLVMISEIRSFEMQQDDYRDRVCLFSAINSVHTFNPGIVPLIDEICKCTVFSEALRKLCQFAKTANEKDINYVLAQIPRELVNYYLILGPSKCGTCGYQRSKLDHEIATNSTKCNKDISADVYASFKIGDNLPLTEIKRILTDIYTKNGIMKVAKATDLSEWFKLRETKVNIGGKVTNSLKILSY